MRGEGVGPMEEGPGGGLEVTPFSSNVPLSFCRRVGRVHMERALF